MKRQQFTIGAIVELEIDSEYFVYGQIIPSKSIAFFDFKCDKKLDDFEILLKCKILFILAPYFDIITRGYWPKVGRLPVRDDLLLSPDQFINTFPGDYRIYNPNTGIIRLATKKECVGLERCTVWDQNHVEDRIRDHYNGVPCVWVKNSIE